MTESNKDQLTIEALKSHRNKQGLSVAEIANRIKVNRVIIQYIEQGEFNRIGSPTFIRGHVGNYAKELGLSAHDVLSLVPEEHLKPQEIKLSSKKGSSPLSRVKTHSSGFGRYVLGTFLVAALGLSFYFVYDKWDSRESAVLQSVSTEQPDSVLDEQSQKKVIYSSLLPQADIQDKSLGQRANTDSQASDKDAGQIMSESFDEDDELISVEADNETPVDKSPDDNSTHSDNQGQQPLSNQALYDIRFNLREQAWVSIKTGNGETVVSDLIGPGERQYSVSGPVHFRIGNAANLSLKINDINVDLGKNSRNNVADFDWPPKES